MKTKCVICHEVETDECRKLHKKVVDAVLRRPLVIIESPFGANLVNLKYARMCLLDSLRRGEYPLASHLLYPQVLDDRIPADRELGMEAGLAWGVHADLTAVYMDHGESRGMKVGIERAIANGRPVVWRFLDGREENE